MSEMRQAWLIILADKERELVLRALQRDGSDRAAELAALIAAKCMPLEAVTKTLTASFHALRSYQHHNTSEELAEDIANVCERTLGEVEVLLPKGSTLSLHNGTVTLT